MSFSTLIPTNDKLIRTALIKDLEYLYKEDKDARIIEEFGVTHGAARVDIAVVNGVMHGYELKSDLDTLYRLPEQMRHYNSVFDQVTLVVGKNHVHEAMKIVPDWWGITIAKITDMDASVSFCEIRTAEQNPNQKDISIASLLWKDEALNILEEYGHAKGVRSKNRETVYSRLVEVLDMQTLKDKTRSFICSRVDWKSDLQYTLNGDLSLPLAK